MLFDLQVPARADVAVDAVPATRVIPVRTVTARYSPRPVSLLTGLVKLNNVTVKSVVTTTQYSI